MIVLIKNIKRMLPVAFALVYILGVSSCSKGGEDLKDGSINFSVANSDGWNPVSRAVSLDKSTLSSAGFGVFGYYTGKTAWASYNQTNNPNFINNTQVTSANNGADWTYSPKKYWPTTQGDKITLFAYAPYKSSYAYNGYRNNQNFVIPFTVENEPKNQVDMLWSKSNTVDLTKSDNAVTFNFKHALAKVGFTIKAAIEGSTGLNEYTSIKIKRVCLASSATVNISDLKPVFYSGASINLNNTTDVPAWSGLAGSQSLTLDTDNFKNNLLNKANTESGNALQLNADDSYLMVLPQDLSGGFKVFVEYDVNVVDLGDGTNKEVYTYTNVSEGTLKINFEYGKVYVIGFNIGLKKSTVELVSIVPWADATSTVISGVVH